MSSIYDAMGRAETSREGRHHRSRAPCEGSLQTASDAAEDWIASLRPPAGVLPSVGDWHGDAPWLERGHEIVNTRSVKMMRTVGEPSHFLMLTKRLGAPQGKDARVDALWNRFLDEIALPTDPEDPWDASCKEFVLQSMRGADATRLADAKAQLNDLFGESGRGLVKLRRLAAECWPTTGFAPMHPTDTPKCWAW